MSSKAGDQSKADRLYHRNVKFSNGCGSLGGFSPFRTPKRPNSGAQGDIGICFPQIFRLVSVTHCLFPAVFCYLPGNRIRAPMKTFLNYLLASSVILWQISITSGTGHAQTNLETAFARSVLLLIAEGGACATGFLAADGKIVTNFHVANGICPYGRCRNLRIQRTNRLGNAPVEELRFDTAAITRISPAMDIAIIEISPSFRLSQAAELVAAPMPEAGTQVSVIGFPACGVLQQSSGRVLGVDPVHMTTSARGAYGSSGSPVFSGDGRLVGITIQAVSLGDAAANFLFKRPFELRAVRADVLQDLMQKSDIDSLRNEISVLNRYYRETVMPLSGWKRMMPSYQFIAAVQGIRLRVLTTQSLSQIAPQFLWFDEYFDVLPRIPRGSEKDRPLFTDIEKLLTALNIELDGPQRSLFRPVKPEELKETLMAAGRSETHTDEILQMVNAAHAIRFQGVQIQLVIYCMAAALVLCVTAAVWGGSVIHVFLRSRGGLFLRAFKAACAAFLLWPVSYLIFILNRGNPEGP